MDTVTTLHDHGSFMLKKTDGKTIHVQVSNTTAYQYADGRVGTSTVGYWERTLGGPGVVSITLIILQPLAVGDWCTPCLIGAAAMLVMIPFTLDEVVAMCQFLVQARREGQPFWRVFWLGGTLREAPEAAVVRPDVVSAKAMVWGMGLPWNLLVSAGLGVWIMLTPSALGSAGPAAHSDHVIGALIVTFAVMALADVGRAMRFVNVVFGAWVIAAPWLLAGATSASRLSDVIVGALVIFLSLKRGPVRERYGSWLRYIR